MLEKDSFMKNYKKSEKWSIWWFLLVFPIDLEIKVSRMSFAYLYV